MSEYKLSDRIRSGTDIMQRIVGGQRSALIELSDEVAVLETKLEAMEQANLKARIALGRVEKYASKYAREATQALAAAQKE